MWPVQVADFCGSEVLAAQGYRVLQVQDLRFGGGRAAGSRALVLGFGFRV